MSNHHRSSSASSKPGLPPQELLDDLCRSVNFSSSSGFDFLGTKFGYKENAGKIRVPKFWTFLGFVLTVGLFYFSAFYSHYHTLYP